MQYNVSGLQDVVPEVVKREGDLSMLQLYRHITGHTPNNNETLQEESDEEGLDEKLVRKCH